MSSISPSNSSQLYSGLYINDSKPVLRGQEINLKLKIKNISKQKLKKVKCSPKLKLKNSAGIELPKELDKEKQTHKNGMCSVYASSEISVLLVEYTSSWIDFAEWKIAPEEYRLNEDRVSSLIYFVDIDIVYGHTKEQITNDFEIKFSKPTDTVAEIRSLELKDATDMQVGIEKEVRLIFKNIFPRPLRNLKLIASGHDFGLEDVILKG